MDLSPHTDSEHTAAPPSPHRGRRRVVITYCTQCRWMLRATWMAQELLTTFADDLEEVTLAPGRGGIFRIDAGADDSLEPVWNRKRDGGFPEIGELKRRVRDVIAPDKSLGHHDRVGRSTPPGAATGDGA